MSDDVRASEQEPITAALKRWTWLTVRLGLTIAVSMILASYVYVTMAARGYALPGTGHWHLLVGLSVGVILGWWAYGVQVDKRPQERVERVEP